MYLIDPVLSCHLKIPLNLCCQLFDNVNNFLLFVKNLSVIVDSFIHIYKHIRNVDDIYFSLLFKNIFMDIF